MMTIKAHLSSAELEARYKTAVDPIGKSHFHALWLLSCRYEVDEVAELLSFSQRWVRALLKRYNEVVRRRSAISEAVMEQSRRSSHPMLWRFSGSGSRRRLMTAGFGRDRRLHAGSPSFTGSKPYTTSAGGML
jgi:hypothetical protein